jgi:hypothetical protein
MGSNDNRSAILSLVAGGLLCLFCVTASADDWPIAFTSIQVTPASYQGIDQGPPTFDCQPEFFDPMKNWYRNVEDPGLVGITSQSADMYEIKGEGEAIRMTIDSWNKQGDDKTVLPQPYSLTKYMFGCASEASQVFEFKKNGRRYALYTHISEARFSPDLRNVVLFNYVKTAKGSWQALDRVIEIATKKYSVLPRVPETRYLADVTNDKLVTYGPPIRLEGDKDSRRRIVAIWGHDGKLIRALSAPIQTTAANAESSDDGIGLLPGDPTVFYHLTRTSNDVCTLRLQDIERSEGRRSIRLNVPGTAMDPAAVGMHIQIDLADLKLKGGTLKYRVAASGRGDVVGDWGPWQIGE